jgi:hypothetical protein
MSLTTPERIRRLQRKLYVKAKATSPGLDSTQLTEDKCTTQFGKPGTGLRRPGA